MTLVLIPGIASNGMAWRGMPAGQVLVSGAETIEGMAADILRRAPDRFALAGHSMGGYIALAMIHLAPERITRLALLSTSALADDPAQCAARRALITAAQENFANVVSSVVRVSLHPVSRSNAALMEVMAGMMRAQGAEVFSRQQRAAMARCDRMDLLGTIAVPTLVLSGQEDRIVAPARSAQMAAAITQARLVMIPNCGHFPQREAPADTAAALEAWLEGDMV